MLACAKAKWSDQEPGLAVIANAPGSFEGSGRGVSCPYAGREMLTSGSASLEAAPGIPGPEVDCMRGLGAPDADLTCSTAISLSSAAFIWDHGRRRISGSSGQRPRHRHAVQGRTTLHQIST